MGVHIQNRQVPDPSMTDSEFIHQRRSNPTKPNVGRVWVAENAMTRIGALCHIRRRLQHHEMAAEHFKGLYESCYGSGTPAIDPSNEPVDTSLRAHDSGMAHKVDKAKKLRQAEQDMGKPAFNRLVALLVLCIPAGEEQNWRKRKASVDQVLADLDVLSRLWGYMRKAA